MGVVQDLKDVVGKLTGSADAVHAKVQDLQSPAPTAEDTELADLVAQLNSVADKLNAALQGPQPEPEAAPPTDGNEQAPTSQQAPTA